MAHSTDRWQSHPGIAIAIRTGIVAAPFVAAVASSFLIARLVPRPDELLHAAVWWVAVAISTTLVLMAVDHTVRRLLPLATLMQLTLVFPDQAPSRFGVALRSASPARLRALVAEVSEHGLPTERGAAAAVVLELATALNQHDRLTRGHCERVRAYAEMIADEMRIPEHQRERLRWSALLHDVGKLFVPGEILNKAGRPTEEEWELLKKHPEFGEELCAPLADWFGEAMTAIGQHHERYDGGGYPRGLSAAEQGWAAKIVQVADTFDVMTSVRSYKKAMPAAEARAELLRCSGTQFDPAVVRAFMSVSLGRLRLVMGPLAALAQLPLVGPAAAATPNASAAVAATGTSTASGAVTAVVVSVAAAVPGALVAPPPPPPPAVYAIDASAQPAPTTVVATPDGAGGGTATDGAGGAGDGAGGGAVAAAGADDTTDTTGPTETTGPTDTTGPTAGTDGTTTTAEGEPADEAASDDAADGDGTDGDGADGDGADGDGADGDEDGSTTTTSRPSTGRPSTSRPSTTTTTARRRVPAPDAAGPAKPRRNPAQPQTGLPVRVSIGAPDGRPGGAVPGAGGAATPTTTTTRAATTTTTTRATTTTTTTTTAPTTTTTTRATTTTTTAPTTTTIPGCSDTKSPPLKLAGAAVALGPGCVDLAPRSGTSGSAVVAVDRVQRIRFVLDPLPEAGALTVVRAPVDAPVTGTTRGAVQIRFVSVGTGKVVVSAIGPEVSRALEARLEVNGPLEVDLRVSDGRLTVRVMDRVLFELGQVGGDALFQLYGDAGKGSVRVRQVRAEIGG